MRMPKRFVVEKAKVRPFVPDLGCSTYGLDVLRHSRPKQVRLADHIHAVRWTARCRNARIASFCSSTHLLIFSCACASLLDSKRLVWNFGGHTRSCLALGRRSHPSSGWHALYKGPRKTGYQLSTAHGEARRLPDLCSAQTTNLILYRRVSMPGCCFRCISALQGARSSR